MDSNLIHVGDRVVTNSGDYGTVTKVLQKEGRAYVEFDTESFGRKVWGNRIIDLERELQPELFGGELQ